MAEKEEPEMKVVTKQKVVEYRVPEYEPGDIVCVEIMTKGSDWNETRRKWVVIVEAVGNGHYDAIPIECPMNRVGFNIWKISNEEIARDCDVLHVPVKDVSDVTVTTEEELEQ